MRIYLPVTSTTLAELAANGTLGPAPLTAFAVTPGLRDWYLDDDAEALEYAALTEAARGSLRCRRCSKVTARTSGSGSSSMRWTKAAVASGPAIVERMSDRRIRRGASSWRSPSRRRAR